MEIKIYSTHKVTICYDEVFFFHNMEKDLNTIETIINVMKSDMNLYGFVDGYAIDTTTGAVLVEIKNTEKG